jgi:hypothetical protein
VQKSSQSRRRIARGSSTTSIKGGGIRYLSHPIDGRHLSRAIDQLIKDIANAVCRLLAFNKKLKHRPKILLTRDEDLGRQLVSEGLITNYLENSRTCEDLLSAVCQSMA